MRPPILGREMGFVIKWHDRKQPECFFIPVVFSLINKDFFSMIFSVLKLYHLTTSFHWHKKQKVSFDYAHFNFLLNFAYIENNSTLTAQKIKFSIKAFFSKCNQIRSFPRIWPHLLKKSLMENIIFCTVTPSLPSLRHTPNVSCFRHVAGFKFPAVLPVDK